MAETSRQRAAKRLAQLKEERSSWDGTNRMLAEHFLPRKSRWLLDTGEANRGGNRHTKVIDGTPIFAARTLASGMLAGLSSPSRPWIRFVTEDEDLMEYGPVKEWLELVQKRMLAVFAKSNFYNVLASEYGELGVFGTAPMMILQHPKEGIRCRQYTCGSYFLAQNADEVVDTFYYEGKMTVRQLVKDFGEAKCSPATQALYKSGSLEQWINIVHLVEPNEDAEYGKADAKNKPYRSCWYETGNGDAYLRESGFEEFPVMAPRWARTGEDVYGSSPAMDALGDAKALQHQQKQKAKQVDKMSDPPMWGTPELKTQKSSLLPGDLTYSALAGTGTVPFQPVYVPRADGLTAIREDAQEIRERISKAMYEDLFLMLANSDRRQITAEEVARKYEEKVLMLDPVLTQTNKELLTPAIDRVFYIMARRGDFPEPPPELEGQTFKPDYISILAQAQRMVTTGQIERLINFTMLVGKAQAESGEAPTAFDKIDFDQSIDEYNNGLGAPVRIVRPDDQVAEIRQKRQAQQQAQQMAAMAQPVAQVAGAAKDLSETQVGGVSALDRMAGVA